MPDFDANEDPLRLSDSDTEEPLELPKLRPRFSPRARALACGDCFGPPARSSVRLAPMLGTRGWRTLQRACPSARAAGPMAAMPTRRRRLWTPCHGRAPGSPS
ncbi:MAG TPA: hypothetical protein VN672_11775 [Solirubrobacteraceae bacterium]|nr:hypothetical protein [Solirubrobacteraceae bacterium]